MNKISVGQFFKHHNTFLVTLEISHLIIRIMVYYFRHRNFTEILDYEMKFRD